MIKDKSEMGKRDMLERLLGGVEIDLNTSQGEIPRLLSQAENLCKKLNMEWEPIKKEMIKGDRDHLIKVFEEKLGKYIIFYR